MSLQAIESLKHFAGKANELQFLRDRVQELEELLGISDSRRNELWCLRLSNQQSALVGLLLRSQVMSREAAYTAIYSMRVECDQPEIRILDVHICRIRKVLASREVEIKTVWGTGWLMTDANKMRLLAAVEREKRA